MTQLISTWYSRQLSNSRLRKLTALAKQVEAKAEALRDCSDDELLGKVAAVRGSRDEAALLAVFAAAAEAVRRETTFTLHTSQLVGGLVLTGRRVAEMKTGEGKTLSLVAPVAWAALEGEGAHVVTANSYLAKRDSDALRAIYGRLGLTVGCVEPTSTPDERRAAYACDITYGVNQEFGFDYLRDQLVTKLDARVQRTLHTAFVDELDAILIDDARTPLILSGVGEPREAEMLTVFDVVRAMTPGVDYVVNERDFQATLTDDGYLKAETALVGQGLIATPAELYTPRGQFLASALQKGVAARALYRRGRDYLVDGGEVLLVDASTGRAMPGRRLEEGLHEMLEAKEGVRVNAGTVLRGSITYQSFFSLYGSLCGLTGTAFTEAEELLEVYGLETVLVPTHAPVQRIEREDQVFATKVEKIAYAVEKALELSKTGQPLLIGTGSVRDALAVAKALKSAGLNPAVLTAEHIAQEAQVVADAGRLGAVTVATAMAGRGTDIALGGHGSTAAQADEVRARGGLFVLGFERNGLRRVDLQLVGRSARQGDPGEAQFLLSLEDDLLRAFGQSAVLRRAGDLLGQGAGSLSGRIVTRAVTGAQSSAERQGAESRRSLQKLDQVGAHQREAFYGWRASLLESDSVAVDEAALLSAEAARATTLSMLDEFVSPEQWPLLELKKELRRLSGAEAPVLRWSKDDLSVEEISDLAAELAKESVGLLTAESVLPALLAASDDIWSAHLAYLDELGKSVQLATKIGKDPALEYSLRSYEAFKGLRQGIGAAMAARLFQPAATEAAKPSASQLVAKAHDDRWVTRNEACPCGSGKRFKLCHGRLY